MRTNLRVQSSLQEESFNTQVWYSYACSLLKSELSLSSDSTLKSSKSQIQVCYLALVRPIVTNSGVFEAE